MILRLLKLLIVALVLHAVWRSGTAYWEFYQFRDKVQEAAQFSAGKTDAEVHDRVMQQAAAFRVPVKPENVQIRRDGQQTYIDVTYVKDIELVPKMAPKAWPFTIHVDAWAMKQEIQTGPR